jgi:hypothetical protein
MKVKDIAISILIGLFLVNAASLAASAQYIDTTGGGQIYVNQPNNAAQPGYIMPPASMAPNYAPVSAANAVPPYANFAQQPYSYAAPYSGAPYSAPYGPVAAPCGVSPAVPFEAVAPCSPVAAPCGVTPVVAPCAPFTSGFEYSAQQSSAFGPFTPPVTEAAEQFYQYPGLTPFGPYPGAGYAAAGGVGFDPISGYYGPYGAVTPL